jgi:hypothetical protein
VHSLCRLGGAQEVEASAPEMPTGTMEQILEIAQASRWHFHKYSRLRTREQFAKGKFLNRKRTMEGMFVYSKEVRAASLDVPLEEIALGRDHSLQGRKHSCQGVGSRYDTIGLLAIGGFGRVWVHPYELFTLVLFLFPANTSAHDLLDSCDPNAFRGPDAPPTHGWVGRI